MLRSTSFFALSAELEGEAVTIVPGTILILSDLARSW